jgi:hypothetical protein
MSRENDAQTLHGRLAVMRSLWDYEREQILEVLGLEINPAPGRPPIWSKRSETASKVAK